MVQMPAILAKKCKTSIDYVIACVGSFGELRDTLVQLHQRYFKRPVSSDVEAYITEIRQGIEELTQMMVTFSEFIDSAGSFKHSLASGTPSTTDGGLKGVGL